MVALAAPADIVARLIAKGTVRDVHDRALLPLAHQILIVLSVHILPEEVAAVGIDLRTAGDGVVVWRRWL